jgi:hypothetical protein
MKIVAGERDGYEHTYEVVEAGVEGSPGKVVLRVGRRRARPDEAAVSGTVTTGHELTPSEALALGHALVARAEELLCRGWAFHVEQRFGEGVDVDHVSKIIAGERPFFSKPGTMPKP